MKARYRSGALFVLIVCLLLLNFFPVAQATTVEFTDSAVIIFGKTNHVSSLALWLFGFKFLVNKQVAIQAYGEAGEKISALILPPKIGFYLGHENIYIQLNRVTGLFFWGGKSLLFGNSDPPRIFAVCKANYIYVSYD
ncbi:MAG: hypothetical protein JW840_05480 [Candidatus Thermoplasmatota archaeon]|nr:hypothetical protein [Candidatus Thermoplasmatota archaeon]